MDKAREIDRLISQRGGVRLSIYFSSDDSENGKPH